MELGVVTVAVGGAKTASRPGDVGDGDSKRRSRDSTPSSVGGGASLRRLWTTSFFRACREESRGGGGSWSMGSPIGGPHMSIETDEIY